MPYAYYAKLKPAQQAIYRASDRVERVTLAPADSLGAIRNELERALRDARQAAVQRQAQRLGDAVLAAVGLRSIAIKVLAKRPSHSWGELHGEYQPADRGTPPLIRIWMRTAQHKRVVAFKTFLRTLLHELCHHLDYALLELADSFHTEGFFKRESSLFKQVTEARPGLSLRGEGRAAAPDERGPR
jgi:hypothetical protein